MAVLAHGDVPSLCVCVLRSAWRDTLSADWQGVICRLTCEANVAPTIGFKTSGGSTSDGSHLGGIALPEEVIAKDPGRTKLIA